MKDKKPSKNDTISLYRNEAFDNGFYQYFKQPDKNKISQVLNNKERNLKFESISYRELNSWEKAGLLTVEREGREWRRFSIIDAIWVKLLKELREFGVSWKQLKVTKKSLEFESDRCGVQMPMLEFYTAFVIAQKIPVVLLVFKNGISIPVSFTQYKMAKETIGLDSHVQISLNDLVQGLVPDVDLKPEYNADLPLDLDEMELLAFLRMESFEKVEIFFKDGKMRTVEGMQRLDATMIVNEAIKEHKYQKIEVIIENGQKVSLRRTVKKQINKKGITHPG
jgi:DNA-binding transcriptional MerR regulator